MDGIHEVTNLRLSGPSGSASSGWRGRLKNLLAICEGCPPEPWRRRAVRIMYYVYIIQSINYPDQIYVGYTENMEDRLSSHNRGSSTHTEKYRPWKLVFYASFDTKEKALDFELFLKSGSGREFRNRRII